MKIFSSLRSSLQLPLRPRCAACAALCEAHDAVLCHDCHARAFAPVLRCMCCALPMPDMPAQALPLSRCAACLKAQPSFDETLVAANFEAELRSVLHRFKFHAQPGLARWFAKLLAPQLTPQLAGLTEQALLVPVPLSAERLVERGYNQSWEITKQLHTLTALPARNDAILRIRHTPQQSMLSLKARKASVKNAFACPARLDGRQIVVVDDVMTSGATLEEIARTLKKAGAAKVSNAVVFRAVLDD